jgi:pyruvate-formate lyase-activating enzyme
MTKILCLGNNTRDTDTQTRKISHTAQVPCHGLLSDLDGVVTADSYASPGYYHSSVYDIEFGKLLDICNQFDGVVLLDQPVQQWSHPDAFYKTLELISQIKQPVEVVNSKMVQGFDYFSKLVQTNKSFCIFPFVEMLVNFDYTTVCCRSSTAVTKTKDLKDFGQDKNYVSIRKKMLAGELLPQHCSSCYKLENQGIISARQQETVEWANRLELLTVEDLAEISSPAYYEIRPSNKCNLQCRMCNPSDSHLIEKEYRTLGLLTDVTVTGKNSTGFDIVDFENVKKIYVAGGEPTIMPEFYEFLDRCIAHNKTDVEFLVNTNGTKLSERFKNQLQHFSNFHFVFSIDGFKDLNHYIRWPSDWNVIVDNLQYLKDHHHKVTVNTTVSIYNIARLHHLFEFIDSEFPNTTVHCQIAENLSPFDFPDHQLVIASLQQVQRLNCYKNDLLLASSIDGYLQWFYDHADTVPDLSLFFEFNDKLDRSRHIKLKDYLPELDQFR